MQTGFAMLEVGATLASGLSSLVCVGVAVQLFVKNAAQCLGSDREPYLFAAIFPRPAPLWTTGFSGATALFSLPVSVSSLFATSFIVGIVGRNRSGYICSSHCCAGLPRVPLLPYDVRNARQADLTSTAGCHRQPDATALDTIASRTVHPPSHPPPAPDSRCFLLCVAKNRSVPCRSRTPRTSSSRTSVTRRSAPCAGGCSDTALLSERPAVSIHPIASLKLSSHASRMGPSCSVSIYDAHEDGAKRKGTKND